MVVGCGVWWLCVGVGWRCIGWLGVARRGMAWGDVGWKGWGGRGISTSGNRAQIFLSTLGRLENPRKAKKAKIAKIKFVT